MTHNFAIIRSEKIHSIRALRGCLAHNTRTQEVPNADPALRDKNIIPRGFKTIEQCMHRFNRALGDHKPRTNAVLAREFIVTASPEALTRMGNNEIEYFHDAMVFLNEKMGSKQNLVCAALHRDESSNHLHLVYICMVDGKLSDRKLLGGHKDVLSKLQSDFWKNVGKKHGLDRGLHKSKVKHQTLKEHYAKVNYAEAKLNKKIGDLKLEIEVLQKQKEEFENDAKRVSSFVFPALLERLRKHFSFNITRNGDIEEILQEQPTQVHEPKAEPENERIERAYVPRR